MEKHPYWLVVVVDDSHHQNTASKRASLATSELMDKTGVFRSSLSLTVEPWSDLQHVCEKYASLIQSVSGNLELKCTIEHDMSDCTSWISPMSGGIIMMVLLTGLKKQGWMNVTCCFIEGSNHALMSPC